MDARAALARNYQQRAIDAGELANGYRHQRDQLIRLLRQEDPKTWTYQALADAIGISPELAASVCKESRRRVADG